MRQLPAAFLLHFDAVASVSRAAADLLRLCAFLHPDAIPEEIFAKGATELGPNLSVIAADPLKLNAAFAKILKYSLLRRDADAKTLSIHRLVQAVIQDGLTGEEKRQWAERAVRAVDQGFPSPEFSNWAQCERLVPQALACASLVLTYSFEFKEALRLFRAAHVYLDDRARSSEVAREFEDLALLLRDMRRTADAEVLEAEAQAIRAAHAKDSSPK